jgi:methylenetetrahydrofolate--tRNA-(uracil-5-)-methyltransferase
MHDELRRCRSLVMRAADANKVPAGGALAVDREAFAAAITEAIASHPLIDTRREEIASFDDKEQIIVASGPLTSEPLADAIHALTGQESLHFFDAIAPIVTRESIDMSKAWMQSRYDKGEGSDYINCAMEKQLYEAFIHELLTAPTTEFKEWEKSTPYFEGCLPIEVMAARGPDTLRFGPMKPVGLTDPRTGRRPYAVVQLRQDNALGTLYNMVGFQTKLKHGEQVRVFRMIPGLENAEFARLGGLHRNTFIDSPKLLDERLRLTSCPNVRFAGQITGVEGYVESTAMGLLAGLFTTADIKGVKLDPPPRTTAMGALLAHIAGGAKTETFQPMNVTFGLFPPIATGQKGRERKLAYTQRAKKDFHEWAATMRALSTTPSCP